jgi:hypothetical protein
MGYAKVGAMIGKTGPAVRPRAHNPAGGVLPIQKAKDAQPFLMLCAAGRETAIV